MSVYIRWASKLPIFVWWLHTVVSLRLRKNHISPFSLSSLGIGCPSIVISLKNWGDNYADTEGQTAIDSDAILHRIIRIIFLASLISPDLLSREQNCCMASFLYFPSPMMWCPTASIVTVIGGCWANQLSKFLCEKFIFQTCFPESWILKR